ncbi:MAG: hypothetical protein AB1813_18025 [Verrucomicrobiota bacterium]
MKELLLVSQLAKSELRFPVKLDLYREDTKGYEASTLHGAREGDPAPIRYFGD